MPGSRNSIRLICVAALGAASFLAPLSVSQSSAHDPYFKDAPSPQCTDEKMLKRIKKRFRIQARNVHACL